MWEQSGVKTVHWPVQSALDSEQCIMLACNEEFRFIKFFKLLINMPLLRIQVFLPGKSARKPATKLIPEDQEAGRTGLR